MNRFVANKIIKNQKVAKLRLEKMYCLISSDECYVYFTGQWESIYEDQEGELYILPSGMAALYFDVVEMSEEVKEQLWFELNESPDQWESRTGEKSNWNNKPKSINQLKKESGEYLLDAEYWNEPY